MTTKTERELRRLLFLNHGCSGPALYGDDGEMQDKSCGIDFRRDPPATIEARWTATSASAREVALKEIDDAVTELEAPRNATQYGEIHELIEAARIDLLRKYLDSQDRDLSRLKAER